MKKEFWLVPALVLAVIAPAWAQQVAVNRENKTIEVTVSDSANAVADQATLNIAYFSYGKTHDAAYEANVNTGNAIIKALTDAGVPRDRIESHALELNETPTDEEKNAKSQQRDERRFKARQSWTIRISTAEAPKVLDVAVAAGANDLTDPEWDMADPGTLEAAAYTAAVDKARVAAEKIAKAFGGKVGQVLYVSNVSRPQLALGLSTVEVSATIGGQYHPRVKIDLLPPKIEKTATVHAIFALE